MIGAFAIEEAGLGDFDPADALPVALGALVLGVPLAWRAWRGLRSRRPAPLEGSPARPPDLLLALPLFVLGATVVGVLLHALYPPEEGGAPVHVLLAANPLALSPLLALVYLRVRQAGTWRPLGLGMPARGAVVRGLSTWVLCVPLLWGLNLLSPWLYELLGLEWSRQAWGGEIASAPAEYYLLVALLAAVVVPVCEEIVFRGWLQQGLAHVLGGAPAVAITAVLFTVVHGLGQWLPILVLASILGLLRHRTQRLLPCIAVHVVHNGVQVALLFLFPDLQ